MAVRAVGDVARTAEPEADDARAPAGPADLRVGRPLALGEALVLPDGDLHAVLAAAREAGRSGGRLRVEFLTLDDFPTRGSDGPRALPEAEARALMARTRVRRHGRLDLAAAPVPGAQATAVAQTSFVQDYDLAAGLESRRREGRAVPAGSLTYDPVIGVLATGLAMRVEPVDGEEGDARPRLRIVWSAPAAMPSFRTRLDGGPDVRIELPEVRVIQETVTLRPGRTLVPIGKQIEEGLREDYVRYAALWIDFEP